jgi:hypothetical protein
MASRAERAHSAASTALTETALATQSASARGAGYADRQWPLSGALLSGGSGWRSHASIGASPLQQHNCPRGLFAQQRWLPDTAEAEQRQQCLDINCDQMGVKCERDNRLGCMRVHSTDAFREGALIGWLWGALHACQPGCAPQQGVPLPASVRGCNFLVGDPQCPLSHCRVATPADACNARVQPRSGAFDLDAPDRYRYFEVVASQDIPRGREIWLALQPCDCDGVLSPPRARGSPVARAVDLTSDDEAEAWQPPRSGSSKRSSSKRSASGSDGSDRSSDSKQRRESLVATGLQLRLVQPSGNSPLPKPYYCCTDKCCEDSRLGPDYVRSARSVSLRSRGSAQRIHVQDEPG